MCFILSERVPRGFIFTFMPFLFVFLLASFPSGLVIYFTFSNALGVVQQYVIMRMMGVEVHLFKRTKEEKEMEEAIEKGPKVHPELEVIEHDVEEALFGAEEEEKPAPKKAATTKKKTAQKKKSGNKKTDSKKKKD